MANYTPQNPFTIQDAVRKVRDLISGTPSTPTQASDASYNTLANMGTGIMPRGAETTLTPVPQVNFRSQATGNFETPTSAPTTPAPSNFTASNPAKVNRAQRFSKAAAPVNIGDVPEYTVGSGGGQNLAVTPLDKPIDFNQPGTAQDLVSRNLGGKYEYVGNIRNMDGNYDNPNKIQHILRNVETGETSGVFLDNNPNPTEQQAYARELYKYGNPQIQGAIDSDVNFKGFSTQEANGNDTQDPRALPIGYGDLNIPQGRQVLASQPQTQIPGQLSVEPNSSNDAVEAYKSYVNSILSKYGHRPALVREAIRNMNNYFEGADVYNSRANMGKARADLINADTTAYDTGEKVKSGYYRAQVNKLNAEANASNSEVGYRAAMTEKTRHETEVGKSDFRANNSIASQTQKTYNDVYKAKLAPFAASWGIMLPKDREDAIAAADAAAKAAAAAHEARLNNERNASTRTKQRR